MKFQRKERRRRRCSEVCSFFFCLALQVTFKRPRDSCHQHLFMCGGFGTFLLFADAGAGHKSLPMVQCSLHAGTTFPGAPLLSRRFGAMPHSLPQSLYRTSLRFQSTVRTCAMGEPNNSLSALGSTSCESGFQVLCRRHARCTVYRSVIRLRIGQLS